MNVGHQEIDVHNPAGQKKSAGFTQKERDSFTKLLSQGFVDTFRHLYPKTQQFTFWSTITGGRKTGKGGRLDYFVTSKDLVKYVKDSQILKDVMGSDHCPIFLILDLDSPFVEERKTEATTPEKELS